MNTPEVELRGRSNAGDLGDPPAKHLATTARPAVETPPGLVAYTIEDLRRLARRRLPKGLFEFVDRGCEDEVSLACNRLAFDRIRLFPRGLVDVSQRNAKTVLFGVEQSLPLVIAPTGAAGLLWYQGEIELARAAAASGIPFTLSTASITSMEKVAEAAGGRLWFQLYMWPDRRMSYQLIDRVKAAGYETLVVTVDTVVSPKRDYNHRNGFSVPIRINRRNALDVALHPAWLLQVMARYLASSGIPRHENYPEELRRSLIEQPKKFGSTPKNETLTWEDLVVLRARWPGPLVVKGVMHPEDARKAADCGADGVIVSNHGGRNFDSAPASIEALPAVVEAVGERLTVMVDSGFTRGSDVVKALALGAKAVLLGRAPLYGCAAAGAGGAKRALDIFREDILRSLAYLGCTDIGKLGEVRMHRDTP
jgi:isopentenyl diphosphate isomerase/L-lactate dehydrogenase-like FMN-dependent dehydrogenase